MGWWLCTFRIRNEKQWKNNHFCCVRMFFFWLRLRVLLHVLRLCAICCGRMCVRACVEWPIYKLLISYQTCFSSLSAFYSYSISSSLSLSLTGVKQNDLVERLCYDVKICNEFFLVFIRNTLTLTQLFVSKFSFGRFLLFPLSFFLSSSSSLIFFLKFSNGNFFRQYVGLSD